VLQILADGPFVQADDQGTLGGQVIFQRQDPQHGSQRVTWSNSPDLDGEGELAAGTSAADASTLPRIA
jgi:hypothetical protein